MTLISIAIASASGNYDARLEQLGPQAPTFMDLWREAERRNDNRDEDEMEHGITRGNK